MIEDYSITTVEFVSYSS